MSTIDTWCQSPDFPWRWTVDQDSQQIKFISPEEKTHTVLAKVFACMRQELEPLSPSDDNVRNSLFKFREVVEERYSRYCKSYCLFVRIWEIFMSIFPGRISTWSEHKKLLRTIDLKLGLIDHTGMPVDLIKPIQKQFDKWKQDFQLKAPCKFMAAIVIKQENKVLYRLHDTKNPNAPKTHFEGCCNSQIDDPNQFFDYMSSCLRNMPGIPSERLKIEMDMISFTKEGSTIKTFIVNDRVLISEGDSSSSRDTTYEITPRSFNVYRKANFLSAIPNLKHIKLPSSILDANNNFF